mmetsp:Transcript_66556/g.81477  ORF Transcript_66556/g.81477 Transcript_66556/m.81477 type:complete len:83 (+) Transcript_66556:3-251(+)
MALQEAIRIYRSTLRAASKFTDYNFRHYFARRAREDFRAFYSNQPVDDASQKAFFAEGPGKLEHAGATKHCEPNVQSHIAHH